ncbi:MAG TPA: (2Fe-2S)-binding protein [Actinomycetes bacterium]|nr:(2Fe-2S)-binding protein [Actinomycetes bacterium]
MYVCICHAVTRDEFDRAVADGARCLDSLGERCGAGTGCGTCHERLSALLSSASSRGFAEGRLDAVSASA